MRKSIWGIWLLASVAILSLPQVGHAALVCRIVSLKGTQVGIVAKPGKLNEFLSLIRAGEKMAAAGVVACVPDVGTKVIITDHGFASHTVRVLDGTWQGCVGDIVVESVGECK